MKLYFITSNKNKYLEVKKYLEDLVKLKWVNLDLLEIQSDKIENIVRYKLLDAYNKIRSPVIVEDSGLFIKALNGFPGPYSKYVYKTIGNKGILKLLEGIDNREAKFVAIYGYYDGNIVKLFRGEIEGYIAGEIRGNKGFGFDPIFIPKGFEKTFAEDYEIKKKISHRARAIIKLRKFLEEYVKI